MSLPHALVLALKGGCLVGGDGRTVLGEDSVGSLLVLALLLDPVLVRVILALLVQFYPLFTAATHLFLAALLEEELSCGLGRILAIDLGVEHLGTSSLRFVFLPLKLLLVVDVRVILLELAMLQRRA